MHSAILRFLGITLIIFLLCSCAQMTRHSNTLVFGTNTTVGIGIGTDATSTPSIEIGIRRQEVALVPLLANTNDTDTGTQRLLGPCPLPSTISSENLEQVLAVIDACHFRATVGGNDRDSYSVLASFGTRATAEQGKGTVSIAQYFATGAAAQQLAKSGGANVIRAGDDAGEIARNAAKSSSRTQEVNSNNEKLAIANRESIRLWVRGATQGINDGVTRNLDSERLKQLQEYIDTEFAANPDLGLLWLQSATVAQLTKIKERFEIPTYPDTTRQRLFLEIYDEDLKQIVDEQNAQDSAIDKMTNCLVEEAKFEAGKTFIESREAQFDPEEMETFADSLPNSNATDWEGVADWLSDASRDSKDDRALIAKIIILYLSEPPFDDVIAEICQ